MASFSAANPLVLAFDLASVLHAAMARVKTPLLIPFRELKEALAREFRVLLLGWRDLLLPFTDRVRVRAGMDNGSTNRGTWPGRRVRALFHCH